MGVPAFVHYAAHFGTVGVDLFFVISGFIMWTTTETRQRSPVQFWLARIVRIVPLYWAFTTLYLAAALITPESFYVVHLEAAHIVRSYLFVPATHPNLGLIAPVYTLGWTLNYEMFFYLLFGFCLFVPSPRLRFALLAMAFLLLVAAGLLVQPQGAIARTYTDPIMLEFLAGVMLAVLSPLLIRRGTVAGLLLIAAAVAWVAVVYGYGFVPERIVSHGVPAVAAVAGALMIEPAARARPSRLWLMLGDASYSIYLAHPFAQRVLLIAVNRTISLAAVSPTVYVLSAFVAGIAGGVVCHFLIERPLLIAGRRLISRTQPMR
jgi:exopolysaccharide production protein ExoZ